MEYHKGYLGYKEKHLHLLSGYKLKFDASREIWNISSEAPPMFALTAAIQLITLIYLCSVFMLKCILFPVAEIKAAWRAPAHAGVRSFGWLPAGGPWGLRALLLPHSYLGWEEGLERQ